MLAELYPHARTDFENKCKLSLIHNPMKTSK